MANMERVLASEAQPIAVGAAQAITLRADQGMSVDLSRLVIQSWSVAGAGLGNVSPVASDASAYIGLTGLLIKGTTQMLRGLQAAPAIPIGTSGAFSGYRGFTPFRLTAKGKYLRMDAGETIVITLNNFNIGGAMTAVACAGVPALLDCDKGVPFAPNGWSATSGAAILAANRGLNATIANPTGTFSGLTQNNITWQEFGFLDCSNILLASTTELQFAPPVGINEPYESTYSTVVNQITLVDRSLGVVGTPDTAGNRLAAPGSMFWSFQAAANRQNPWVRLPVQSGSAGNSVIFNTEVYSGAVLGANVQSFASGPFYTRRTSNPPIGCV